MRALLTRRTVLAAGAGASVAACGSGTATPKFAPPAAGTASAASEPNFLNDLERRCFDWFWDLAHPVTGLTPDRWPTPSFSSVAATGFGLSALAIGVTRGWVTRPAASERARRTLATLLSSPQGEAASGTSGHRGFFYHFLHMDSARRFERNELSTVDTALLLAGVMVAERFFDATEEADIRRDAAQLLARVDWRWAQVRGAALSHGWHPESGFIAWDWKGYNEAMLVYLLALGSDSHGVDRAAWDAWTSTYPRSWGSAFGSQPHLRFAPLFGHQFTHCWVDFRGIRDAWGRAEGLDYFENSVRATVAQRLYAQANPMGWTGYSEQLWGISACDGPADVTRDFKGQPRRFISYAGRGMAEHDDGTLAPYAAGSSIAFTPTLVQPCLLEFRRRFPALWGRYGFLDSVNPSFGFTDVPLTHGRIVDGSWVASDYLGIDQGPLLLMLANHRDGLIWKLMREHPLLQRGLARAGFQST